MELSIFVAKIITLIYLPLGFALITGQLKGKEMFDSFKKSPGLSVIAGSFGVIMGTILVIYHNVWEGWPILITLIGWIAVIESITLLALPKTMFSLTRLMSLNEKLWGSFAILLGLIFGYFGFMA